MKIILFRILVFLWKISPNKFLLKKLVKKSNYLKSKLYKDLRFKGVFKVEIKNGQSVKLFNPGFTTIENEIFWNGIENGWEKESIKQWLYYAKNAEGIVDIGANSGIYSIIAHSVNPRANILAFEPVERTFDLLLKNVDLNTPNNISTYQLAVSNKNGKSLFYDVLSKSQYSASLEKSMLSDSIEKVSYEVDVVKLDTFSDILNSKVDLMKIDVELHEPQAVEGMLNVIHTNRPVILIEILKEEVARKINSYFKDLSYCYFNVEEEKGITEVSEISRSEDYNLLLIPKERKHEAKKNT